VKVLIWQTAFLGDVILTVPLIWAVKKYLNPERITFVGRPFIGEIFRDMEVDLIPFSKGYAESLRMPLRISGHDVALVPHRSLRTALIILASRIPLRIGFDRSEFRFAFNRVVKHRWELHEVFRNLELLKPLGVEVKDPELIIPISNEEVAQTLRKFGLKGKEYIVISPYSNFPLKEMDIKGWIDLLERLRDHPVVVTGIPSDLERSKVFNGMPHVLNLTGKTSLRELMAVLAGAKVLVSADSSPVHIANAVGTPALTLYTATSSQYGFYPLMGDYIDNPAPCSPCSPNPKRCKTGTLECKGSITADSVLEALKKFL